MVWCGVVWCGVVWCGVVWCGAVRCGVSPVVPPENVLTKLPESADVGMVVDAVMADVPLPYT